MDYRNFSSNDGNYSGSRIGHNVATNNGEIAGNSEPHMDRTAANQKWGSSFWKDCPTVTAPGGLESGEEGKSGSEYKGSEEEAEESDRGREVHQAVPVDEMLSDEYYEQDDGDQSDSVNHRRVVSHSSRFSSKPPPRSTAPSSNFRKPMRLKVVNRYNEEDGDYEDDDDEFEDDPNDTDFDPDFAATTSGHGHIETEARLEPMFLNL